MSVLDRILAGVGGVFTTQERLGLLRSDVKDLATELRNHDRRIIRLETLVEIAQQRRGPPRLTDE